jgi:hypothetical protein
LGRGRHTQASFDFPFLWYLWASAAVVFALLVIGSAFQYCRIQTMRGLFLTTQAVLALMALDLMASPSARQWGVALGATVIASTICVLVEPRLAH